MARLVAYDWLVAETEAWPIASWPAFDRRTVRLSQSSVGVVSSETEGLTNDLEVWLRPRAAGMSIEVLRQIRENAWFPSGEMEISLADYLLRLARRYLEPSGGRFCLAEDLGMGVAERAGRWRWLSYLLPEDLFPAVMAAEEEGRDPGGESVHLLTHHLSHVIQGDHPVAETHLHVGAAVPFPLLWTGLLASLADDPPSDKDLQRGGPPPFGSAQAYRSALFAAAITRLLMAEFLRRKSAEPNIFQDFEDFCSGGTVEDPQGLRRIAQHLSWSQGPEEAGNALMSVVAHFVTGSALPHGVLLQALYRSLIGPRPGLTQRWSPEEADPVSAWLGVVPHAGLPETRLTSRALRYLLTNGRNDRLFELTFWQYQRVRCLTFRHLVEEPGTSGLDWFSRHYQRIGALRRKIVDQERYRHALEIDSADTYLGALEARTAPPNHWVEVFQEIEALTRQAASFQEEKAREGTGRKNTEVALLFHFVKDRDDKDRRKMHAEPGGGGAFLGRYGSWYYSRLQQVLAVKAALDREPAILLVLRGLDIANAELAVPTWVSLPLFQQLKTASDRAAARLREFHPEWKAVPFHMTSHLGEDFVRLGQGLRRIHEPIEFGLLTTGSRIGHAVALGVDPETWGESSRTMPQTLEERLDDLLWELERYGKSDLSAEAGRLEFVRQEIGMLSRRIYDDHKDPYHLLEVRRRLHSPDWLARLDYPFMSWQEDRTDKNAQLLRDYLINPTIFRRSQEKVEVRADASEIRFLRSAQEWLRQVLGRLEITIESNPSSNLLIGDFLSLDDHPVFRLHPILSSQKAGGTPVMISLNVDDPVTFASHLADEFAHVYFALTRQGVSSHEALSWLCQVRDHGWRSRFTLAASGVTENLRDVWESVTPPSRQRANYDKS